MQLRCDVSDRQMGIQIKIRITRQICPWQTSCSLASGLQDSQICVYLKNGRAYKTPGGRGRGLWGRMGADFVPLDRGLALAKAPVLPSPGLLLLMAFADGFKGNWAKQCGSQLEKVIWSPCSSRVRDVFSHRKDSPVLPGISRKHSGVHCVLGAWAAGVAC